LAQASARGDLGEEITVFVVLHYLRHQGDVLILPGDTWAVIPGFLYVPSILCIQRDLQRCVVVCFLDVSQGLVDLIEVLVAEGHPEFVIQVVGEEL
jgi:hypothetical protein